jgi:chromate transporter
MTWLALYWLFLRAMLLSFSGFTTVPLLRDALVLHQGLLTDTELNDAIAISQASPGPLGMYVVVVGYFVAGWPGALAGVLALATPAPLAVPIARLVRRGHSAALQGACTGIIVAACGLMVATGLRLAQQAASTPTYLAVIVMGILLMAFTRIQPVWVIIGAAGIGLIVGLR